MNKSLRWRRRVPTAAPATEPAGRFSPPARFSSWRAPTRIRWRNNCDFYVNRLEVVEFGEECLVIDVVSPIARERHISHPIYDVDGTKPIALKPAGQLAGRVADFGMKHSFFIKGQIWRSGLTGRLCTAVLTPLIPQAYYMRANFCDCDLHCELLLAGWHIMRRLVPYHSRLVTLPTAAGSVDRQADVAVTAIDVSSIPTG